MLHINITIEEISSTFASLFIGISYAIYFILLLPIIFNVSSVSVIPGPMTFIRILRSASSDADDLFNPKSPNLLEQYAELNPFQTTEIRLIGSIIGLLAFIRCQHSIYLRIS